MVGEGACQLVLAIKFRGPKKEFTGTAIRLYKQKGYGRAKALVDSN